MRADEVSNDWNRTCLSPYHPFRLEVRQYVPIPGDGTSGGYNHLNEDFNRDWNQFTDSNRRQNLLANLYKTRPVLFSVVRNNGMRCIRCVNCKCLDTFVCFACCQDGARVYGGAVADAPLDSGWECGVPYNLPEERFLGEVQQPCGGGGCHPTLHLLENGQEKPYGRIDGPYCFGGWLEMCVSFRFATSYFDSPYKAGDIADIIKQKPIGLSGAFRELMSEADTYQIKFHPDAVQKLSPARKITVVGAQLLADYMFFDGNTEKCKHDDSGTTCYCWYCSCIGWLAPCYIFIPNSG